MNETLEVRPPAELLLTENFDADLFASGAIPHPFDRLEDTLRLTNANLLFYHVLGLLYQHLPFDFDMLLRPQLYEREWRHLIGLLLDFHRFKSEYAGRHMQIVETIAENGRVLGAATGTLGLLIDRKTEVERLKGELAEQEQNLQFMVEEGRIELGGVSAEGERWEAEEKRMAREEEALEEELRAAMMESNAQRQALEDAKALVVMSPERIMLE